MASKSNRRSTSNDCSIYSSNVTKRKDEPTKIVESEVDRQDTARFLGDPIPESEAMNSWPERYKEIEAKEVIAKSSKKKKKKQKDDDEEEEEEKKKLIRAQRHYKRAIVDGIHIYDLYDHAYVQGNGNEPLICKIVEMFEGDDGKLYFTSQWFSRPSETVIKTQKDLINKKRLFLSENLNINELDSLVKKLNIVMISLNENHTEDIIASIKKCDYFYDMYYKLPYSTFEAIRPVERTKTANEQGSQATLLDLFSGCGAMSTGLCMGAKLAGLNLVPKWAVDLNIYSCQSFKHNHPETEVRNECAEDFLFLLKEWEKLCIHFSLRNSPNSDNYENLYGMTSVEDDKDDNKESDNESDHGEIIAAEKILSIACLKYRNQINKFAIGLKVRWSNHGPSHDSWEPIENLSCFREKIKEFVVQGFASGILPLPGTVDVVCGGPPCQGISGLNRFRNTKNPFEDEKNRQLLVYMNIVEFLKPKYVLLEHVVDMLTFAEGYLASTAVGRLVQMNYQTRTGIMAAGAYGLAQYRMRFFLWGAHSSKRLPQFPLPTHFVVVKGYLPEEFERNNLVAYTEENIVKLEEALLLRDVIADLPNVANDTVMDVMPYEYEPRTPFQKLIRLSKDEMFGLLPKTKSINQVIYDHHPLLLNDDDYTRVWLVPKKKGGSFRDFPGLVVGPRNKVKFDPNSPRFYFKSGKPLVLDHFMSYDKGKASEPFRRCWWDETVSTVLTGATPHKRAVIHPEQDRVLTVRENARLQGFPDYYKLFGPTKEKYIQVGNAVAVPVARALGFSLAQAFQGLTSSNDPNLTLPEGFPYSMKNLSSKSTQDSL